MNTSNAWKLILPILLLAAGGRAGEMHDTVTNYRGYVLAPWAPVVAPAGVTNVTGGAFAATGTWHYAMAAQNSLGISGAGPVTNITVATGDLVRITWQPSGGATNYLIYRGATATGLTEYAVAGLTTSYVDHGTNTWAAGSPASTITNLPKFLLARSGVESNEAVTKAQLDAAISPTGFVSTITSTDATVIVTGSGTARVLSVAGYVEGIRTTLQAGVTAATNAAASALAVATGAQAVAQAGSNLAASAWAQGVAAGLRASNSVPAVFGAVDATVVVDTNIYVFGLLQVSNTLSGPVNTGTNGITIEAGAGQYVGGPSPALKRLKLTGGRDISTWKGFVEIGDAMSMGLIVQGLTNTITNGVFYGDGAGVSNVAAARLGGYLPTDFVLVSSLTNYLRRVAMPGSPTNSGSAGTYAISNGYFAVYEVNGWGTGTNWGRVLLQGW